MRVRFYLLGECGAKNPSAIPKEQITLWESEGLIEYLGVCDDVREIISKCDCVVLPSYREGSPRILLEAMASSKPIITTDTIGCKECVKLSEMSKALNGFVLGENGVLVPLKNSIALKNAIVFLCKNAYLIERLGQNGLRFAKVFDIKKVINVYKKIISKLLYEPLKGYVGDSSDFVFVDIRKNVKRLCEAPTYTCKSIKITESQRDSSDSIESAESSDKIDSHESLYDSRNDKQKTTFHNQHNKALAFISNTCFGMWNFRLPVLKSLQKDGFIIHILAPFDTSCKKLENEGFIVHSISVDSKGLNPLKDLKTIMQIRKILAFIKPNVVFSYTIKCVIYGSFVANILKIPNIAIITGLGYVFIGHNAKKKILQNIVSKMYALALKRTKSVWFLNNDDKGEFLKRGIIAESKSFLLGSEGIDLEHFSPNFKSNNNILPDKIDGEIRFILIARMLWDKGIGEFVEAAKMIKEMQIGGGQNKILPFRGMRGEESKCDSKRAD